MKKKSLYLLIIVIATILLLMLGGKGVNAEETIVYGDVNCDGEIDIADSVIVMRYLEEMEGSENLTDQELKNADVNDDGIINYVDVNLIRMFLVGKFPDTLPTNPITDYVLYGDVNEDGVINNDDVSLLIDEYINFKVYPEHVTKQGIKNADVNNNGIIGYTDVDLLKKYLNNQLPGADLPSTPIENYEIYNLYSDYEYEINENSVSIIKYNGTEENVIIPHHINDIEVTNIEEGAFEGNSNIKSVSIPWEVSRINNNAFKDCLNLTNVEIARPMITISSSAFDGDDNIIIYCDDDSQAYDYAINKGIECITRIRISGMLAWDRLFKNGSTIEYTGSEYCIDFTDFELKEGVDFTVTYRNNIDVGRATVVVKGIGNYSGTKKWYFDIIKKDIGNLDNTLPSVEQYTGEEIRYNKILKNGEIDLVEGKDYTIKYENNIEIGTATVTIEGKGNYTGTITDTFKIIAIDLGSKFNRSRINLIADLSDKTYTGEEITSEIVVKDYDKILEKDKDYTISYIDNTNIGTATVEIKGIGNYSGMITKIFNIVPKQSGEWGYTVKEDGTAKIIKYFGSNSEVIVPETVENMTVTEIGVEDNNTIFEQNEREIIGVTGYPYNSTIVKIELPNTITKIGYNAFSDCRNLKEIIISENLETIEEHAFYNCANLTEINLPSKVKKIGVGAFSDTGIENLTLPNTLEEIDFQCFYNCTNLKSVIIPDTINTIVIEIDAFRNCSNLKTVKFLGDKVSFVNTDTSNCFEGCDQLLIECMELPFSNVQDYAIKHNIPYHLYNRELNTITVTPESQIYTGKAIRASIEVKNKENIELEEGRDYKVSYKDNINVGLATVIIEGIGDYIGIVERKFEIVGRDINDNYMLFVFTTSDKEYTGEEITTDIQLTATDIDYRLKKGTDYKVTYKNNVNIGTATMIVEGIGNYQGTIEGTFKIIPKDITKLGFGRAASREYTGKEISADIVLIDSAYYLKEGIDYKVTYKNNINVGTATFVLEGIGIYQGTRTGEFEIVAKDLSKIIATIDTSNKTYTGKEITTSVSLKDGSTTLKEGTDYKVSYKNNTNVGTATVTVDGIGNYAGTITKEFKIVAKPKTNIVNLSASIDTSNKTYTGKEIKTNVLLKDGNTILKEGIDYKVTYKNNTNVGTATVTITGIGNYTGTISKTFKITSKKLSSVTATINTKDKVYTGKAIKTSIVLKNRNVTLKDGKDYTVTYKNNKNTGKATVTITGKGNYTGTITKTFYIVPKKVTLSSVKNSSKKAAKVTWKKDTQVTGYELYMATSKNGKYSKVKTVTKNKTVTYTKTKLKKNKKYYFKVRSYKTVNGKKIYGAYSTVKYVKIKK